MDYRREIMPALSCGNTAPKIHFTIRRGKISKRGQMKEEKRRMQR